MEEYRYSSPVQILRQKKDVIYVATTTDVRLPFNSILVMDSKVNTYLCKSTAVSMHAYQIVMILKCTIGLIQSDIELCTKAIIEPYSEVFGIQLLTIAFNM